MDTLEHIVIVGGGAGGLELATMLGDKLGKKKRAKITLVDGKMTHFWKPLLHEVAAGTLNVHNDEVSYTAHAFRHHFEFEIGYMHSLNREQKTISLAPTVNEHGEEIIPERTIKYDTLVMSVGSTTNDFGTEGVAEHCLFLDSQVQAQKFQRTFLERWIGASEQKTPLREGQLNVAIAGAGATGVELAAELHTAVQGLIEHGFSSDTHPPVSFTIIDAAERVLPALPPTASASIENVLRKLNIEVLTQEMICKATKEGFYTKSGKFIPAEIKVWAAGVKAPDWVANLGGLETARTNQLMVHPTLQTTLDENIFAMGDCAACPREEGGFVPPRAQAAHQQAKTLYDNILHKLDGKPLEPFVYVDKGSLINLSRYSTVGAIVGRFMGKSTQFKVEGYFARKVYVSLYRLHQHKLHGFLWVILMILADNITRRLKPRLKLH